MAIPETREDLIVMGYEFTGESLCRNCHRPIEWWITPNDEKMPFTVQEVKDPDKGSFAPIEKFLRIPHFKVCNNES